MKSIHDASWAGNIMVWMTGMGYFVIESDALPNQRIDSYAELPFRLTEYEKCTAQADLM